MAKNEMKRMKKKKNHFYYIQGAWFAYIMIHINVAEVPN